MQASHLLKYDSMLGTFGADVRAGEDNTIIVDGKPIKIVSDRNPLNLPWGCVLLELFGFFFLNLLLEMFLIWQ